MVTMRQDFYKLSNTAAAEGAVSSIELSLPVGVSVEANIAFGCRCPCGCFAQPASSRVLFSLSELSARAAMSLRILIIIDMLRVWARLVEGGYDY